MFFTMEGNSVGEGDLSAFCNAMPKVEVHAHLNGSIRNETILELASEAKLKDPIVAQEAYRLASTASRSLLDCFKLFDIIHRLTKDHKVISRITEEVIEDFALENVKYLELRTTPKDNPQAQMTKESYLESVLSSMKPYLKPNLNPHRNSSLSKNGKTKNSEIIVRLLLSLDRRESTESAIETVKLACKYAKHGVIGIDLSGNPKVGQWSTFEPALTLARSFGLKITLHCGEVPNPDEIRQMLAFKPDRFGHAVFLNPPEYEQLIASNVPVEICLTSNVKTESVPSYDDHHFADMYKVNHPMIICTDDCGVFETTLSQEYCQLAKTFGLSERQLVTISMAGIGHIFDDGLKGYLRGLFQSFSQRLLE